MKFNIRLINQSSSTIHIFDQILDDIYTYRSTPLDNLTFIAQKLEKGKYVGFRDIPNSDEYWLDSRTSKECLDSIATIRNPYISLEPHDSLNLNYSFMFGRMYSKGKYRIKVNFKYEFTGKGKSIESDWVYFEVKKDLFRPVPLLISLPEKTLFWQRGDML